MGEKYQKLPGRGVQLYGVKRLYTGADHILQITFAGGAEEYRRFYFHDVQAVIIRRTSGYIWWSVVWGGAAALWFLWVLSVDFGFMRTPMLVTGALLTIPLLLNLIFGPTCSVVLQTAVHKESLTSLTRLRSARKMIAHLIPVLAQVQADLEVSGQAPPSAAGPITPPQPTEEL